MQRKPLIAGNWKMHGSLKDIRALVENIKHETDAFYTIDVVLIPAFLHLLPVRDLLTHSMMGLGAQNLYPYNQGAYTGEISGPMLRDAGCQFVLIGHSERRNLFAETLELIALKFNAALKAGLTPILCVGETKTERQNGQTFEVIKIQIESVIDQAGINGFGQAIVAYEPVWAIGTGLSAAPEDVQTVHAYIRQLFIKHQADFANGLRIIYGGSLKPENASSLFMMPDIDGGLVGGASLDAHSFASICEAMKNKIALKIH